ncbi:MetQ/NlpA family ABC transporter substrate-binding protein [Liquorilactobacillus satsumensis]|uniref:Lipoprotein n=1 Tax=Liquorilactobacillus satsumensis DSM 16230 = JCM 12392 TaxID=1423801 RepID=A0A0R1V5Y4_9LACO|nr:ABC-type metal ion transport system, periplasmic component surface antigen [Liquorilactobacillus satsumensis DSM 16230 = JCM 12392]
MGSVFLKSKLKVFSLVTVFWGLIIFLTGCGQQSTKIVRIGVVGTQDESIWKEVATSVKQKDNITLKITTFTDYNQPNRALASHDIDLNAFQSYNFQDNWNKEHQTAIVALGRTYFQPLGIYSKKISKLSALKVNDSIAIPNDAPNETRSLNLLQSAGLIKLNTSGLATAKNIVKNRLKLKIVTVDAAQTPRALTSVAAAVINGNYASAANIPLSQALYREHLKNGGQYINLISVLKKNKANTTYKKIVKAYQTTATKKAIKKLYKGSTLPAW